MPLRTGTVAEAQHTDTGSAAEFPNEVKLLNTSEVMKCRQIGVVIRFYMTNIQKEPEEICHHLLMLYFLGEMNL